jgi:putative lipoic acid-binding regulatory protein
MSDESLLQFPCDFPIKVMGASDPGFRALVIEQVLRHADDLDENLVRVRESSAGRYQSVTVIVHARDRAQLDAIYGDLSGHPQIRMVL